MFEVIVAPTLPLLSDAPITAIDFGDKIGKGVYVYKLKVKSNRLNKQVEKIQKLVIL